MQYNLNWKPIKTFDIVKCGEYVWLRSQHYSRITKVPAKLVHLCHAAEEWAEDL